MKPAAETSIEGAHTKDEQGQGSTKALTSESRGLPVKRSKVDTRHASSSRMISEHDSSPPTTAPAGSTRPRRQIISGYPPDTRSAKPKFSTYQQHYSPVKPRALLPSNNTARKLSGPSVDQRHPELEALRTELLQLSLVDQQSNLVLQQYKNDIEAKLRIKQEDVDAQRAAVESSEREVAAAINCAAIDGWIQKTDVHHAGRSLQDVSFTMRELDRLAEVMSTSGGLFPRFQTWLGSSSLDRESMDRLDMAHINPVTFETEILPLVWSCERQIESYLTTLEALPETLPESSLYRLVKDYMDLAVAMREECHLIVQIGQALSDKHESWRRGAVLAAITDVRLSARSDKARAQYLWELP